MRAVTSAVSAASSHQRRQRELLPPRTAADRMDASGQPFGAATAALAYALLCLVGRLGLAVWALGARLAK